MSYEIQAYGPKNITLVYDTLPLENVDRTAIRDILGKENIVSLEPPETLIMIAQSSNIALQAGDCRFRVTDQSDDSVEQCDIPTIALRIHNTVTSSQLVAYGFNYDVVVKYHAGSILELLTKTFIPDPEHVEELIGGTLQSAAPRISFLREGYTYNLDLTPIPTDSTCLHVHLNVHFEEGSIPPQEEWRKAYQSRFNNLLSILDQLLEG